MRKPVSCAKRLLVMVLGFWAALGAAFSAETGQNRQPGKVVVASVVGKVDGVDQAGGSSRSLKQNDVITEKYTVNVGSASTATLVFSNGSTITLQENSTLVITEFLQDPFSTPYAMATATEEPTTSVTKLNLVKGEVVCNVKKLRTKDGSSLIVQTPVGAAGVRGTTFAVRYVPATDGTAKGTYTLSVTEGEVALTDTSGNVSLVAAGREIVISVRLATDPVTGETSVAEVLSMEVQVIPEERRNSITQTAEQATEATETMTVGATEMSVIDALIQAPDSPPLIIDPDPTTEVNPPSRENP